MKKASSNPKSKLPLTRSLNIRTIFPFWLPLAATWLMMSVEGPFLAAIIARLQEPKFNLAAYGVAYSFAVLFEAPVIMIMSASTALVKDKDSLLKLKKFIYILNTIVTLSLALFIFPPIFSYITLHLIGLPSEVAKLTHYACLIFLPWPASIGYRRFYQGILIRNNLTRRVAYATVMRLLAMAITALICYKFSQLPGAMVGAISLSVAVVSEAVAIKIMSMSSVAHFLSNDSSKKPLTLLSITKFYSPLSLTSILGLAVYPIITFFLGQSRMAIESLAVLPVINSLVFIFRSMGLSFQEVAIALLGEKNEGYRPLRNFAVLLGVIVVSLLFIVNFTPLAFIWFHRISGLSLELTKFAIFPAQILTIIPGLTVLISFQRAILVNHKKTTPITIATGLEISIIFLSLFLTIKGFNLVGAVAAAIALVVGRLSANGYLFWPGSKILKSKSNQAKLRLPF